MQEDKLKILNMLEQGKITINEAVQLLNALEKEKDKTENNKESDIDNILHDTLKNLDNHMSLISSELSDMLNNINEKLLNSIKPDAEKIDIVLKSLNDELKGIAGDLTHSIKENSDIFSSSIIDKLTEIGSKTESNIMYRGVEEIQKKFDSIPLNMTELTDKLSGIYNKIAPQNIIMNDFNITFKKRVKDAEHLDLYFESVNGSISLEGYDGDEIIINMRLKTAEKNIEKVLSILDEEKLYGLKIIKPENTMLTIDINIPIVMFCSLSLSSFNSRIRADNFTCKKLLLTGSNSKLYLSGIKCDKIMASSSIGKIELTDLRSEEIFIESFNCSVMLDSLLGRQCDVNTKSGNVELIFPDNISGKYNINLTADGGNIEIETKDLPSNIGLYIDAFSQNGSIVIADLPNFSYNINDDKSKNKHIIGQTSGFDEAQNSVRIHAQSINSYIYIR